MHAEATRTDGWGGDGTARALTWLNPGEIMGRQWEEKSSRTRIGRWIDDGVQQGRDWSRRIVGKVEKT